MDHENKDHENQTLQIPLIAGYNDNDEPVVEQVTVVPVAGSEQTPGSQARTQAPSQLGVEQPGEFRLVKSPAFVRGLAADDRILYPVENAATYDL
ncbi:MAG: hypothetical protein WD600_04090, partial [Pseudohongiella sp.]